MTKYCVDKTCQKQLMLSYFGETSSTSNCKVCDVCLDSLSCALKDVTAHAIELIKCVVEILGIITKVSSKSIIKVYCGHKAKKM